MNPNTAREKVNENRMGIPFVPFTFPTVSVSVLMRRNGAPDSSYSTIDKLYDAYLAGITLGLPVYTGAHGSGPIVNYLSEQGFDRMTIVNFLNASLVLAPDFLGTGGAPSIPSQIGADVGGAVSDALTASRTIGDVAIKAGGDLIKAAGKPLVDPLTKVVKYVAFAAIAGVIIYGVVQVAKIKIAKTGKKWIGKFA